MKNGQNPTRAQKEVLVKAKKDWHNWLFVEEESEKYVFRNKTSNKEIRIRK